MRFALVLGAAVALAPALLGQESTPSLSFEVASVKPHPLPQGQFFFRFAGASGVHPQGDRFSERVATLNDLIMDAYEVKDYQISGLPEWAASSVRGEHYDIEAKTAGPATESQLREMLQNLLAERFSLKLHRVKKELPVYALVIGKNGSKLRPMRDDEQIPTFATRPREAPKTLMGTLPTLVSLLSGAVDRPVIDQTGLTGRFEFTNLDWDKFRRDLRATAPLDSDSPDSVFSALQRDLGLKLEARKDPMDVLVIDHAEKPTAN